MISCDIVSALGIDMSGDVHTDFEFALLKMTDVDGGLGVELLGIGND